MDEKDKSVLSDVFDEICSFDWLEKAYRNARKQKRFRDEVLIFSDDLESNLFRIRERMLQGIDSIGPYRRRTVYIPKKRIVMAIPFESRVVQWSIYMLLDPFYERFFIDDSFACRRGKGTQAALDRLQYWLREVDRKPGAPWYCLKLDVSKYFYRVNHRILIEILRSRIRDERLMELLCHIIDDKVEHFGLPRGASPADTPIDQWLADVGMPVGNLTSQLFGNIYLNELDQFCKHRLHLHYYARYMDDVVILDNSKERLHRCLDEIRAFLSDRLALDLNQKTFIRPVNMGIEFVGTRVWATHRTIRKPTVRRVEHSVKKITEELRDGTLSRRQFDRHVASYRGLLQHAETASLGWKLNSIYRNTKAAPLSSGTAGNTEGG